MSVKYDDKVCFNSVPVGTDATEHYLVENGAKHSNWTITQYPEFDIALNAFTVKKKVTKDSRLDKHEIIIRYKPLQPYQTHINYYLIKNIGEKDVILRVTGYSTGYIVQSSVKYINFYRLQNDFKIKTRFELRNHSECKIKFQFDLDNKQKIFEIEPDAGEILPGKYAYITAKFTAEKLGVFFMDLPCLILYHQPIYIELLGVNAPKTVENDLKTIRGQCSTISLENGYEKYMTLTYGSYNLNPVCSITPDSFEFYLNKSKTDIFVEILNYTEQCAKVLWDTESEKDFTTNPKKFYIRPKERCNFQSKFETVNLERFFGGQLYGRVFIFGNKELQEDPDTVILPISVRFIGNSFVKTTKWTPSVEIYPQHILMPVCIENRSVYTTFLVKKFSDFPATFKILPPKRSHFRVKPMVGLIINTFQLFVVKFSSGSTKNGVFEEKWSIEFNQEECVHLEMFLKAIVEEPVLLVGENDQLQFGTVFPGCKKYLNVPLVNKSQNTIKFLFQTNKWFNVEPQEGVLQSYGSTDLVWCYTADCDVEEKTVIFYEMRVIQETKLILGAPFMGSLEIFAKCAYGKLCSSPTSYDFQTVVCGELVSTTFTLYNFSEVTLHFLLKIHEHFVLTEDRPVTLDRYKGSLSPEDHLEVTVSVLTYWSGLSSYSIQFFLRESEDSDILVETKGKSFSTTGTIFRLDYYSFYPTLKFTEIALNTTGPLFGKLHVWEYFNANDFNELLRNIRMNEIKRFHVRLPDAEAGLEITKNIIFIVKNVTREDTTVRFERKKICDCKLQEVKNSSRISSFRKYTYEDCPHRKLISITPSDEDVKAYMPIFVTIQIQYLLHGEQQACFLMRLSHNRTVEIYFEVIGLNAAQLSTYSAGFTLRMNSVFIGELSPDMQIFWFLNNTRRKASYCLDLEPLRALNHYWGHPILTCVNPEGLVDAKSHHYIEFLFAPIAVGVVDLELPFQFGSKNKTLRIIGKARPYFTSPLERLYYTQLGKEFHRVDRLMVNISTEQVVIRALPTHCSCTRLITLRNVHDKSSVGFTFDSYCLEGTLDVRFNPSSGVLAPGEHIALFIHVTSGGVACALRVIVTCHLVDQTALQRHLSTTAAYYKQTDMRNDQFCIGENGVVTYPVPTVEITPAPRVFHRTLAITCHIISQVDLDTKMTIQDQLKQTPFRNLCVYHPSKLFRYLIARPEPVQQTPIHPINATAPKNAAGPTRRSSRCQCTKSCCGTFTDDEFVAVHTVLSCLLRDFLFSKQFKHLVGVIGDLPERHYSEFNPQNLTVEEETEMVEKAVNRVPNSILAETLQMLLADCVLKQFDLGQYPHNNNDLQSVKVKESSVHMRHGTNMSFGKLLYTAKFVFLLDHS